MSRKRDSNWERSSKALPLREQFEKQLGRADSWSSTCSSFISDTETSQFLLSPNFRLSPRSSRIIQDLKDDDIQQTKFLSTNQIMWLDQTVGKKCYMIGSRELAISWGDDTEYWTWKSDKSSRFPEVAVLRYVWWLDIRGSINTAMFSPSSSYIGYLVYKLSEQGYENLESAHAIQRLEHESDGEAEGRAQVAHLERGLYNKGNIPVKRPDGWLEVKLGEFKADGGTDNKQVEVRLLSTSMVTIKRGLIVECIEFRPHDVGPPLMASTQLLRHGKRKVDGNGSSLIKQIFNTRIF